MYFTLSFFKYSAKRLTFRELVRTTSLSFTVFFTFNNTVIACQETSLFQNCSQFRFVFVQSFSNTVFDSACLTRQTTAFNRANNVKFIFAVCNNKRLIDNHFQKRADVQKPYKAKRLGLFGRNLIEPTSVQ